MSPHTPPDEPPSWFVMKLTATASLGGCLFGYDMGAISGALPQLQQTFNLTEAQQEWLVSILYIGGGVGASIGGGICDVAGRKVTIILTDVVFMLGALWLYLSQSYEQVLIGRFVVGVGVAVSGVADVSYLHECAPIEWRGSIVSVNEACISLGFLLAYIAGYVYSSSDDEEWRIIFGWAGLLAAVQFIGMIRLPESPAWLSEKGKVEEARKAWQQINNTQGNNPNNDTISPVLRESEIDQTTAHSSDGIIRPPPPPTLTSNGFAVSGLANIGDQVGGDEETYQHPKNEIYDGNSVPSLPPRDGSILSKVNYWCKEIGTTIQSAMIILSRYRRQVYVALFLATTQQFCGQTIVLNYAPMIFAEAAKKDIEDGKIDEGDDGTVPDWSTVAIGLVKFIVTVLVIWRIEFVGRRILLIAGTSLIAMGLLALIVAFGGSTYFSNNNGVTDEDSAWSPLTNLKTFHLALPGVLLVVCGYSMSFGPLTWLLTSELFPTDIRGRALGASTIVTYCCAALVTRTFLSAQSMIGPSKVFAVYCVVTMFGILFEYLAIPDTGEKTVEQIDEAISRMHWWRFDSIAVSQIDQDVVGTIDSSRIEMSPSPSQDSLPSLI